MANPLFNMLGNNSTLPGSLGNLQNFMSQLTQFRQQFHGNPQQQVQQLLNSGKMTQFQYNQLSQMATQIQSMLSKS